jgi:hypothetical protein
VIDDSGRVHVGACDETLVKLDEVLDDGSF